MTHRKGEEKNNKDQEKEMVERVAQGEG